MARMTAARMKEMRQLLTELQALNHQSWIAYNSIPARVVADNPTKRWCSCGEGRTINLATDGRMYCRSCRQFS